MDVPPVWDCLPNIQIHCWTPSLRTIGDKLGKYIDRVNPKENYSCTRICVQFDLEADLPEAIKLMVGEWKHYQKLDYEQFPSNAGTIMIMGTSKRNYQICP